LGEREKCQAPCPTREAILKAEEAELDKFVKRKGWHTFEVLMACSMTNKTGKSRKKIEVFTANYPIKAPDK